jgi:hypothetical protein
MRCELLTAVKMSMLVILVVTSGSVGATDVSEGKNASIFKAENKGSMILGNGTYFSISFRSVRASMRHQPENSCTHTRTRTHTRARARTHTHTHTYSVCENHCSVTRGGCTHIEDIPKSPFRNRNSPFNGNNTFQFRVRHGISPNCATILLDSGMATWSNSALLNAHGESSIKRKNNQTEESSNSLYL